MSTVMGTRKERTLSIIDLASPTFAFLASKIGMIGRRTRSENYSESVRKGAGTLILRGAMGYPLRILWEGVEVWGALIKKGMTICSPGEAMKYIRGIMPWGDRVRGGLAVVGVTLVWVEHCLSSYAMEQ
jgi:hypothetical protein